MIGDVFHLMDSSRHEFKLVGRVGIGYRMAKNNKRKGISIFLTEYNIIYEFKNQFFFPAFLFLKSNQRKKLGIHGTSYRTIK